MKRPGTSRKKSAPITVGKTERVSKTRVRVRYAETDQMGVVYYSNYFVWFEIGRVELLRQLGFDYKHMELEDDCWIPVVDASCRYMAPALYDDILTIHTEVAALRRSVLKFRYRVIRVADKRLLAEGETVHVITDSKLKSKELPQKYADGLKSLRPEPETPGAPEPAATPQPLVALHETE
jgi:acyl-CoA thioester hydrolase